MPKQEQPTYTLKWWCESINFANDDTISFNAVDDSDGVPVDCINIRRRGDKYMIRGHWKSFEEAKEYAKQILAKWLN